MHVIDRVALIVAKQHMQRDRVAAHVAERQHHIEGRTGQVTVLRRAGSIEIVVVRKIAGGHELSAIG